MYLHPLPAINSKYFNWKELIYSPTASRFGIVNNPTNTNIISNLARLSTTLSAIREAFGKPIIVNSGYRNAELNHIVGGHPKSLHMSGRAADLRCLTEELTYQLYIFCDQRQKDPNSNIRKVIYEQGKKHWVHLEIK